MPAREAIDVELLLNGAPCRAGLRAAPKSGERKARRGKDALCHESRSIDVQRREGAGMTTRKTEIPLASRLTAYVSREQGAAELQVSPSTWDDMVECGQLPPPLRLGRMKNIPRWRWEDVDKALSGEDLSHPIQESYFRERTDGAQKDRRRVSA